jgi:hypothetical protein
MIKKLLKTSLAITICFNLAGCSSECTEDTLTQKSLELTEKLQEAATSGDMSKIMTMTQKMQKFKNLANDKDNLQAACDAMDELLDEL